MVFLTCPACNSKTGVEISATGKMIKCEDCGMRAKLTADTRHMVKAEIKLETTDPLVNATSYEIHGDQAQILFGMSAQEMHTLAEEAIDHAFEYTLEKKFQVF